MQQICNHKYTKAMDFTPNYRNLRFVSSVNYMVLKGQIRGISNKKSPWFIHGDFLFYPQKNIVLQNLYVDARETP